MFACSTIMSYNGSGIHCADENQYPPATPGYWSQQAVPLHQTPWSTSTPNSPANTSFPPAPYSHLHHPSGQWNSPGASPTPQYSGQYSFQLYPVRPGAPLTNSTTSVNHQSL